MGVSHECVEEVLDAAITAYAAAVKEEEALTTCMFELMSEYVALRLHVTEKTAQLLFAARLSIYRMQRLLDSS